MQNYTVEVIEVREVHTKCVYTVEAESEEQAHDLAEDGSFTSRRVVKAMRDETSVFFPEDRNEEADL